VKNIDEDLIYKLIGEKIRQHREGCKIDGEKVTQERLANEIGVSRVSIVNFENGKQAIYLSDLYKVANFFKADVNAFLPSIDEVTQASPEQKINQDDQLTNEAKALLKSLIGKLEKETSDE